MAVESIGVGLIRGERSRWRLEGARFHKRNRAHLPTSKKCVRHPAPIVAHGAALAERQGSERRKKKSLPAHAGYVAAVVSRIEPVRDRTGAFPWEGERADAAERS